MLNFLRIMQMTLIQWGTVIKSNSLDLNSIVFLGTFNVLNKN